MIAIVESSAPRGVPVVVMLYPLVVPIASPVVPPPPIAVIESDSVPGTKRNVGSRVPDSRIRIPSRPSHDHRVPIDDPGVVGRHVDNLRVRRLNNDRFVLGLYHLLLRRLQIARLFGFLPHH